MKPKHQVVNEIKEQVQAIYESLDEIRRIMKEGKFEGALKRAEAYWMAHIDGALENRKAWLGSSFISAAHTIDEIFNDDEN